MLIKILIGVAAVIALLVIVIATRSSDFRVTRSATISAPAQVVFAHVNELRQWHAWSPWARMDPNAKETFEGPAAGTGAIMRWAGNKNVGEGSMTIVESQPGERIRFRLDFIKPFAGTASAEFEFKASGDRTTVSWTMLGKNNFIAKAMSLFMDCEKMVGGQFDQGLAALKQIAEAESRSTAVAQPAS